MAQIRVVTSLEHSDLWIDVIKKELCGMWDTAHNLGYMEMICTLGLRRRQTA